MTLLIQNILKQSMSAKYAEHYFFSLPSHWLESYCRLSIKGVFTLLALTPNDGFRQLHRMILSSYHTVLCQ